MNDVKQMVEILLERSNPKRNDENDEEDEKPRIAKKKKKVRENEPENSDDEDEGLTPKIKKLGLRTPKTSYDSPPSSATSKVNSRRGSKPYDDDSDQEDSNSRRKSNVADLDRLGEYERTERKKSNSATIVYVQKEPEELTNLYLSTTSSISAAEIFTTQFIKCKKNHENNIKPVAKYISNEAVEEILAYERREKIYGRVRPNIYEYDDRQILDLLRRMVVDNKIRNLTDFVNELRKVKFPRLPEDFQPGLGSANFFRGKIANYQLAFLNRYEYMEKYADQDFVAPLEKKNHNDGLVTIFTEGIPHKIGINILKRISANEMRACKKGLGNFFDVFDEKMTKVVEDAKGGLSSLDILKGPREWDNERGTPYYNVDRAGPEKNTSLKYCEDPEPELELGNIYEDDDSVTYENTGFQGHMPEKFESRVDSGQAGDPVKRLFDPKARKPMKSRGSSTPGGCLDHVYGKCDKGADCKWQHGPTQLLKDTWDFFAMKLIRSAYARNYADAKALYDRVEKERTTSPEPALLKTLKHA